MSRVSNSSREIVVGLIVLIGFGCLLAFLFMAGGGPGFLAERQSIEVDFRDAQGVRSGCPVRVAGLDAGRVVAVGLAESEQGLRARIRVTLPRELVDRLRQDVQISIQASLTGQSVVNILGTGRSEVALVPGQVIKGVEASPFDGILEQVGMGPAERDNLSQTIAEVRETVVAAGPRLRTIFVALQETIDGLRDTAATVRPVLEQSVRQVEETLPRVELSLAKLDSVHSHADQIAGESRPLVASTLKNVNGLAAEVLDIAQKDRVKVESLLDGFGQTRLRADRVLYNADVLTAQGAQIVSGQRAEIERSMSNIRDATGWADKLVQKLYSNPFYLSPLYKPNNEDLRAQAAFDAAQNFTMGAKEFHDALKTLQTLQGRVTTAAEKQKVDLLLQRTLGLTQQMSQTQQQIADNLRATGGPRRRAERE